MSSVRASSARRASRLRLREGGLLRLALQAALLFAALLQLALGLDHAVAQLGVPLLAVGQLHVQLFEAGLAVTRRSCRSASCASTSARSAPICSLRARVCSTSCDRRRCSTCSSCVRPWASAGLAAHRGQPLGRVGIGGFGPHQGGARLVADQRLGAQLFSRCSISWARASRPDCSESCA